MLAIKHMQESAERCFTFPTCFSSLMIIVSLIFSIGADSSFDENINLKKVHDRISRLFHIQVFKSS